MRKNGRNAEPGSAAILGCTGIFERVDSHLLCAFPELVRSLGGDPLQFLKQVDLEPRSFRAGHDDVSYRQPIHLVARAATDLNCPDFGMRLARLQAGALASPLAVVARNARTLGEALELVVSHSYAHSLAAALWLKRAQADEQVMMGHELLLPGIVDKRQAIEQILLVIYLTLCDATGGLTRARRIDFRHQPMSPPETYYRHFGCETRFGQRADAILFSRHALACPIKSPNFLLCLTTIARIETEFLCREPPLHAKVRGAIMKTLGTRACTNLSIAQQLKLHPRAMHRRLSQEGTSFQRIKNEVRRDVLIDYLENTTFSVAEMSERLGFGEQSALTRFAHTWLRSSPTEHRSQRGHKAV